VRWGTYSPIWVMPLLIGFISDRWPMTRKRCGSNRTRSTYRMWHITAIWRRRRPWRSSEDPPRFPTAAVSSRIAFELYLYLFPSLWDPLYNYNLIYVFLLILSLVSKLHCLWPLVCLIMVSWWWAGLTVWINLFDFQLT